VEHQEYCVRQARGRGRYNSTAGLSADRHLLKLPTSVLICSQSKAVSRASAARHRMKSVTLESAATESACQAAQTQSRLWQVQLYECAESASCVYLHSAVAARCSRIPRQLHWNGCQQVTSCHGLRCHHHPAILGPGICHIDVDLQAAIQIYV